MQILLKSEKSKKVLNYILIILFPFFLLFLLNFSLVFLSEKFDLKFVQSIQINILISIIFEIISFLIIPIYLMRIFGFNFKNFFKKIDIKLLLIIVVGVFFITNVGSILTQIFANLFFNNQVITESYIENIFEMFKYSAYIALFSTMFIAPIIEEFFFRGILSLSGSFLEKDKNKIFFPIISGILFALAHFDFVRIPYLFTVGFCFAYIFLITENLWYTIISHLILNTFASIGVLILLYSKNSSIDLESIIYSSNTSLTSLFIKLIINLFFLYLIYGLFKNKIDDYKISEL